nr:reverse transcriptase domain-containing protein [Tanacetum cinerariifolium]
MFNSTLTENTRVWFDDLPTESIDSYDDLKKAFLENYLQQKKCIKDPIELHNIKQRDGESTEDFVRRQKITQSFSPNAEILFPPLIEKEGTKGMIIEAEIGGHCIYRMYMDGESASEIMYEHCFNRLHLKIKKQLVPTTTPLIGFSGEIIWPIWQIQLLVRIGDEEHSVSAWMNFVVVRSPSPYNVIIRRLRVRKLQAVSSTAHGMLKLPVEGGVITLKSSRLVPLECVLVSRPGETLSATKPNLKERVKVKINLEYSEQAVMIGSTLTERGHNKLCGLLQRNLDIFAWKPADMTGIPRHIAKHRLNVREGCYPVRKKKRGQAADRNQAIYEEVGKLMEAGIMKEVYYHDWLSNPMMRLDAGSKNWMEELSHVLWAHYAMIKSSKEDTSFSLTYRTEAVIPTEIGMPTLRTVEVDLVQNNEALEINLDLLEERREQAAIREAKSKTKMEKYYNSKVRNTSFKPGDLVYRNNDASRAKDTGKLGPKWEGSYEVTEALGNGAYKLKDRDGKRLPQTWNVSNLKKCYIHKV